MSDIARRSFSSFFLRHSLARLVLRAAASPTSSSWRWRSLSLSLIESTRTGSPTPIAAAMVKKKYRTRFPMVRQPCIRSLLLARSLAVSHSPAKNYDCGCCTQARIKKIMQTDEDVGKISQATPILICTRDRDLASYSTHRTRLIDPNLLTRSFVAPSLAAAKALELFMQELLTDTANITAAKQSRTLSVSHLYACSASARRPAPSPSRISMPSALAFDILQQAMRRHHRKVRLSEGAGRGGTRARGAREARAQAPQAIQGRRRRRRRRSRCRRRRRRRRRR